MTDFKQKYDRYGASEWATLVIGVVIFLIQVTRYAFDMLSDNTGLEAVVSGIWILLVIFPKALVDLIKRVVPSKNKE